MDAGQWEVRIQAKHILTGETRYFRDWALLANYLTSKLDAADAKATNRRNPPADARRWR